MIRFRGMGMWTRIFVDGTELRTFALPYSQVEVDVPESALTRRELVVLSCNQFSVERVPLQENFYDFYAYGGIFRSVELHVLPEVSIARARLTPTLPNNVHGVISLKGMTDGALPVLVRADGEIVLQTEVLVAEGRAEFQFTVPGALPWSAESPSLYTVTIETPGDDVSQRIGFRSIETVGGELRINGEPVKLLGYCRHEAHPQYGPALPLQQLVQDLQILKDMGCNFIRGSHYPQDPDFLALCDELGFYVFEESLGWGNRERHFSNPAFCEGQVEQTRLMIEKSFNHPSVIMWGFLNEGASNEAYAVPLYRTLYELCKEEDPTRPATFASMHPFEDLCFAYCDIISINTYPGWYAHDKDETRPLDEIETRIDKIIGQLARTGQNAKPFLISEIGAGAIYGWRDPLNAHWTEDYQSDYLGIVCRRVVSDRRIAGVAIWQFFDCRTYSSAHAMQRPRAFNNKGSLDEYRRPKLAFHTVKKIFTEARS